MKNKKILMCITMKASASQLLKVFVGISVVLINLMINQKSSLADEQYDSALLSQYIADYVSAKECTFGARCIFEQDFYLLKINDLLEEVGAKAIRNPSSYCAESRTLYDETFRRIKVGIKGYSWINKYCEQNGR